VRIYFDTSAMLKRPFAERESSAFNDFFTLMVSDGHACATSVLTRVETARAIRRHLDAGGPPTMSTDQTLEDVIVAPISQDTVRMAETIGPPNLRSLDAIHLATAIVVGAQAVVTYDERLRWAAFDAGMLVIQPDGDGTLPDGWGWLPGSDVTD